MKRYCYECYNKNIMPLKKCEAEMSADVFKCEGCERKMHIVVNKTSGKDAKKICDKDCENCKTVNTEYLYKTYKSIK